MKHNWEEAINEFLEFSIPTFKDATWDSSLEKLKKEIFELECSATRIEFRDEYVDCLMALIDSAKRNGITPQSLLKGFVQKTLINKERKWKKNLDNTYSHI